VNLSDDIEPDGRGEDGRERKGSGSLCFVWKMEKGGGQVLDGTKVVVKGGWYADEPPDSEKKLTTGRLAILLEGRKEGRKEKGRERKRSARAPRSFSTSRPCFEGPFLPPFPPNHPPTCRTICSPLSPLHPRTHLDPSASTTMGGKVG